jgi:glutathione S-transferase
MRWRTGRTSTPALLADDGAVVQDSTKILQWIQAHPEAAWRPYAAGPAALELEERFDDAVGPAVRRIMYFYLLQDDRLARETLSGWRAGWQGRLYGVAYPVVKAALRSGLGLDAARTARSVAKLDAALDEVDATLADGRTWLVGDALSAADLTLAALLSPLLLHPAYPAPLPPVEAVPAGLAEIVRRIAARPAGQHATRVYGALRAG